MKPAVERRRTQRMPVDYEVFLINEGRTFSCQGRDLSIYGIGLFSERQFGKGSPVDLSIIVPEANINFQGAGRVRHVSNSKQKEQPFLLGIEFAESQEKGLPFVAAADKPSEHNIKQSVSIGVDAETCYRALSNVERFIEWDSGCVSAKVQDRYPDGRARQVEFTRNMLIMNIHHVDEFSYNDERRELSWKSVGSDKELVKNEGGYNVTPISDRQCLLTFHINLTVSILPAPRIINYFSSIAVRKELKNFKKMVETEHARKSK